MSYAPADRLKTREQYDALRGALWTERASFDDHWRELGNYFMPRRMRFQVTDRNKGDRRNQNIIDSTGTFAVRTLQSGLHAGLTSPARPWLRLTTPDPEMAEFGPVKAWLHTVTQRLLTVFLQSNLYNILPIVYGDAGVFATAAMAVLEDDRDLFRCVSFPIGSYALGLDHRGMTSTFVREYQMTVGQLVEDFGGPDGMPMPRQGAEVDWTRFSPALKTHWDRGEYHQAIDIVWMVHPNRDANPSRLRAAESMPFKSCHFEKNSNDRGQLLRESGYRQFPVLAPRWDVTGEDTYGTNSPGMMALGDNKQLQVMSRKEGQAIEKMVNPPLQGPTQLKTQKVSLLPGDVNYLDVREANLGLRPVHEVKPDLGAFMSSKQEVQYRINRAFFVDLFQMLAASDGQRGAQPITAREIEERHEEKLLALGPVLERFGDELHDPLVDRVFDLLQRAGGIPEPPEELRELDLPVEYTSLMAQAQKLVGVVGLDRMMGTVANLAQVFPSVLDKVKANDVVDEYASALGVNPKLIRSDDEADAIGQQRAQAQAQAEQSAQLAAAAKAGKDLGTTPMTGDTALSRLVEAAGVAG